MIQQHQYFLCLILFISLSLHPSNQTQLFRDLVGSTNQNLAAEASQWTLSDPSGTPYPIPITTCNDQKIIYKSDSLPQGTAISKTFDSLESHNMLRIYFMLYYIGAYTSQTVSVKIDDLVLGTAEVTPLYIPDLIICDSPFIFSGFMFYYVSVPHTASAATVEFVSNLHDTNQEVTWGIRTFSLAPLMVSTVEPASVSADTWTQKITITRNYCGTGYIDDQGDCQSCTYPCEECYGPGTDQCLTYRAESPENRLCPESQTFLTSGCTNCAVENCLLCDEDVSQCDTCLTTCASCDDYSSETPQCLECTIESNLLLYEGTCVDTCPQGSYLELFYRKCPLCQSGCLDCSGAQECIECHSETTSTDGLCICDSPRKYFEDSSGGCSGTCLLGCEQCLTGQECQICSSGTTLQLNGDCRCDLNGFYYQDDTGSCTGQCYEYCDYCHDASSCISCSGGRIPKDGMCQCESPRILIGTTCECPAYMIKNPLSGNCEYIDLVDIAFQSPVSPLFDMILQFQTNPLRLWTSAPSIQWTANCPAQDVADQFKMMLYLIDKTTNMLVIPTYLLGFNLQCTVQASYYNENGLQILKEITYETGSASNPQVNIVGGPFQMFNHAINNLILAQVQSSVGKPLSPSDLKVKWTQISGDQLDMTKLFSSSDPFKLTIPKCILEKGKIYKFQLHVELKVNPGSETSQEVTIAVFAPKFQVQINGLTDNYHLLSKSVTLDSQLSLQEDTQCTQASSLSDLLDLSTAMYTWECVAIDLQLSPFTNRLLLTDESAEITDDLNASIHPDPLQLFHRSTTSSSLTVPSSYFTDYAGYQFIFYLIVTVQSTNPLPLIEDFNVLRPTIEVLKSKSTAAIVSTKPFTTVSFSCHSENNCQAFSKDFPTKVIGSSFNYQYSYNYQVSGLYQYLQYNTFLNILASNVLQDFTVVPRILYTISDGTNVASSFFTLPLNPPPQSGTIYVSPTEGDVYTTKFFINTYGWADNDLPVYYEFYTTIDPNAAFPVMNKMPRTLNSYEQMILASDPWYGSTYVGVLVRDNLKLTSQIMTFRPVILNNEPMNFCEAVNKSSEAFDSSKTSDSLFDRFKRINVILNNLQAWESYAYMDPNSSPCIQSDIELKFLLVTEMKEIGLALNSKEETKVWILNTLMLGFSNPEYNQDKNVRLYMDLVDYYSLANTSTTTLSSGEYNSIIPFVDSLIWAMKIPGNTLENPDKIWIYINTLIRSTLADAIPTEEGVNFLGDFYTYFTAKTTYCKVLKDKAFIRYEFDDLVVNVTLRPGQTTLPEQCNDQIDMIFLGFRPEYDPPGNPDGSPQVIQTLLFFDLRDSLTGKSLLDIFTFFLLSGKSISSCPPGWSCRPGEDGGTEVYGIFDLKNQINKIFAKSNLEEIGNISVLAHFQFWKSVAFYTVVAFSIGFLTSLYWLYVKHPTYCALIANKSIIITEPLIKKINLFFWLIHPLVGIYIYSDKKITKPVKLAIYYQRLVVVMLFSTIFSNIEKGEGRVFKTYILLFNTVTVTPANALFSRIFEQILSTKKSNKKFLSTLKLFLGILFYLILVAACFIAMFIIEAQLEDSQNKEWATNFVIAFVQDLTLSPAISIFYKAVIIKLTESQRFGKTLNKSPKIIALIVPETFKSIYSSIFVTIPVAPKISINAKDPAAVATLQSPRMTTMSPMSTNRKLLKFSTLDFNSPVSARVNTPVDFKTKIASENEIGSVDMLPMETLISNRFQTLFSEGKIETIRQGSPKKENFEKMQATNPYIKNPSTQQLLTISNVKSSLIKQSLHAKPFTSIEFKNMSPSRDHVEMSLDEIWSFAEHPEDAPVTQPKFSKNVNTMESPFRNKKKQMPEKVISKESPSMKKEEISPKKNELALKKVGSSMESSSILQFKEPSEIQSGEIWSFDGGSNEEIFASPLKVLKKGKIMESSLMKQKNQNAKMNKKNKPEKSENPQ